MAITLTTLNGTDSIAATRITINDNFSTISAAMNSLLSIIDIATGLFDNTGYGSNSNINTENLTVTGSSGITVTSGSINIPLGNLILGGAIEFGSGTNVKIKKVSKPTGPSSNIFVLDLAGASAATGGTAPGSVGYVALPRATTSSIQSIQNPELGSIVYDTAQNVLAYCVGTSSGIGTTGTWYKISATGATTL
jgi:hypothetical protein